MHKSIGKTVVLNKRGITPEFLRKVAQLLPKEVAAPGALTLEYLEEKERKSYAQMTFGNVDDRFKFS